MTRTRTNTHTHTHTHTYIYKVKVKCSRYRPGVAQRVGRGIALLFHDRGTRRGWVVSSTPRPHFTPGNNPVPIAQEDGWAPGSVCTGGKSRPHRDSIPHRPARSIHTHTQTVGRDSSVGIASRYGLDGPGTESRWGRDFQHPSRPALVPT